jgi:hypothetical protein
MGRKWPLPPIPVIPEIHVIPEIRGILEVLGIRAEAGGWTGARMERREV